MEKTKIIKLLEYFKKIEIDEEYIEKIFDLDEDILEKMYTVGKNWEDSQKGNLSDVHFYYFCLIVTREYENKEDLIFITNKYLECIKNWEFNNNIDFYIDYFTNKQAKDTEFTHTRIDNLMNFLNGSQTKLNYYYPQKLCLEYQIDGEYLYEKMLNLGFSVQSMPEFFNKPYLYKNNIIEYVIDNYHKFIDYNDGTGFAKRGEYLRNILKSSVICSSPDFIELLNIVLMVTKYNYNLSTFMLQALTNEKGVQKGTTIKIFKLLYQFSINKLSLDDLDKYLKTSNFNVEIERRILFYTCKLAQNNNLLENSELLIKIINFLLNNAKDEELVDITNLNNREKQELIYELYYTFFNMNTTTEEILVTAKYLSNKFKNINIDFFYYEKTNLTIKKIFKKDYFGDLVDDNEKEFYKNSIDKIISRFGEVPNEKITSELCRKLTKNIE